MIHSANNASVTENGSETKVLGADDIAELKALFDALPAALALARKLLHETSVDSAAYIAADAEFSRVIARVNALLNR